MERPALFRIEQAATAAELLAQRERVIAAGFDGVELWLGQTGVHENGVWPACATALEQCHPPRGPLLTASVEHDLKVSAIAAGCVACEIDPALKEVTMLLSKAASLHARCLNLTIPPLSRLGADGGFAYYQDALNFAYELLHRARYEAEATGVAVALEAAANGCLLSPVELREIIDAANSWAVGACIDVSRTLKIGSPADWLMTLKARVHAVRVNDIHLAEQSGSPVAGETVDIEAIAAALDEIQYERPVIVCAAALEQCHPTREPEEIRMKLAKLVPLL